MNAHANLLLEYNKPAHNAVTTPAASPIGEKYGLKNNVISPPNNADRAPKYAPRTMPTTGAIMFAAVMALLNKPITWERGKKESSAYNAAKDASKAKSYAVSLCDRMFALHILFMRLVI